MSKSQSMVDPWLSVAAPALEHMAQNVSIGAMVVWCKAFVLMELVCQYNPISFIISYDLTEL